MYHIFNYLQANLPSSLNLTMPTNNQIPGLVPTKGEYIIDVVNNMITFMAATITTAAVLALITGSILYLQSYGKEPMIEKAKTVIKWAIWGMVMGLLSFGIVQLLALYITGLGTGKVPGL